jgi:hypothetical protein
MGIAVAFGNGFDTVGVGERIGHGRAYLHEEDLG